MTILDQDGQPIVAQRFGVFRAPAPAQLAEWQADCARLFGSPNEQVSWLHLDWYDDEDVNRLVVYQCTPRAKLSPLHTEFLDGPPPRKDARGRATKDSPPMLRQQWEIAQQHRCWAQPYWIIQGARGGHKRRFSAIESQLLKLAGLPITPPDAGALPYAPWDTRVIDQLVRLDDMRRWEKCEDFASRQWATLDQEEQDAVREMKKAHLAWLDLQVEQAIDSVVTRQTPLDIPTSRDVAPIDVDLETERFISQT